MKAAKTKESGGVGEAPARSPWVGIEAKTGFYPGMAGMGKRRYGDDEDWVRRSGRILGKKGRESHCYHLMSRTCGGEIFFDEVEKEALVKLIGKMSRFCGVEVLTYGVMGNHFHVLARVWDKAKWMQRFEGEGGEARLLAHLGRFYSRAFMEALRWQLSEDRRLGDEAGAQMRLEGFKARLCDVAAFMQELKLRFSKWYNKRHGRKGTLWMSRYKSVLVEESGRKDGLDALRVMGLYIDLNPLRAGLVEDPAAYRWSGYGAAVGGEKGARWGLVEVTGQRSWVKAAEAYRTWLCAEAREEGRRAGGTEGKGGDERVGGKSGKPRRHGVRMEKRVEVLQRRGKMGVGELIQHRVRYFSEGAVIGSREFVREQISGRPERDREVTQGKPRRVTGFGRLGEGVLIYSLRKLRSEE